MTPLRIATRIVIAAGILLVAPAAEADLPPSCVSFTDTPLVAGSTVVKAAHLTELRQCIDDLRAQKSLAPSSWTDPVIVPQQTPVKAAHVTEMRTALNEVYSAAGQQAPNYSGAPIAGVTTIAATHFNELRSAAQNAPAGPCNIGLSPSSYPGIAPAAGGTGSFTVAAGCSWTATSSASWLNVSQIGGSGNQTLQVTFAENTSGPRSAYVDVGGQHFNITQGGVGTTADLIYNGDFELGFNAVNDQMGTGQLANGWILAGDPEYPAQLSEVGIPGDKEQWVEVSGGIRQFVTMMPDVEYLLTADIYVSGTVGLYMQTVPVGTIQSVLNVRQGAQRMRLPITHSAAYAPDNVLVSILSAAGATVRIDHVSLRPTAEVMAEEIVQNANFENGFHSFGDANGSGWLGNSWTHSGQSTPPQGLFDPGGPSGNLWQNVNGGAFGTGVHQAVTLQANQKYLVRANVLVEDNGGAKLAVGPTGGAEVQLVYVCGPAQTWHGLATMFTPAYTGQYTVGVTSHIAWSHYSVDDISITPTSLTTVQPSTAGNGYGTECIELHELTFEVNDATNGQPLEGATVQITPNYGSGPPRTTYPNGTISYAVAEGALTYSVSRAGYITGGATLNIAGENTIPVALTPQFGTIAPPSAGLPPGPPLPATCIVSVAQQNIHVPNAGEMILLQVNAPDACHWEVSSQFPWISADRFGGTGTSDVVLLIHAAGQGQRRKGSIVIGGVPVTIYQADSLAEFNESGGLQLVYCDLIEVWQWVCSNWDGLQCYGGEFVFAGYIQRCWPLPPGDIGITRLDVAADIIHVDILNPPVSAILTVELVYETSGGSRLLYEVGRRQVGRGTHVFTGWRQNLPAGKYIEARARWTDVTARLELTEATNFDVLGVLRQTIYTTFDENDCQGPQNGRGYLSTEACVAFDAHLGWLNLTEINGTGRRRNGQLIKFNTPNNPCTPNAPSFREIDVPRGGSNEPLTDATVAARISEVRNGRLRYGDYVLIVGMPNGPDPNSIKIVNDACPGCDVPKDYQGSNYFGMDNYQNITGKCTSNVGLLGALQTIRLPRGQ